MKYMKIPPNDIHFSNSDLITSKRSFIESDKRHLLDDL